jgi:hypothetical protein
MAIPSQYSKDRKTLNEMQSFRTRLKDTYARLKKSGADSDALNEILACRALVSAYTWPNHMEQVESILRKYQSPVARERRGPLTGDSSDIEVVFGATETTDEYRAMIRTRQEKARIRGGRFRKLSFQYALHNVRVGFDESILAAMPDDEF